MTTSAPPAGTAPADLSRRIAAFVAASRPQDMSQALLHEAKRTLLNHLAAGFGGCRDRAIETLAGVLVPFSGPAVAPLIGRPERVDALTAAFLNAALANVLDFDDTHLRTVIHPAAPVAPALFALAALRPLSGAGLLHALILGIEVACRLGNAVSPGHYERGWHITSTCGAVGAAAAVAKALGLDADRTLHAMGGAATQACGLVEMLGFDVKSLNVGAAARNGLMSALLAERGFAGPERPLEGPRGFVHVMGERPDYGALADGLGASWQIELNTYKPYPCGVVLHPVIDACLDLRARHGLEASEVVRVVVRGHPLLRARTDRPEVSTGREAQVSLKHTVGVCLVHGRAGVEEFTDEVVHEPAVRSMGRLVEIEVDGSIPTHAAHVRIETAKRGTLEAHVPHARGSLGRPLTDSEIEAKLKDLAQRHAPRVAVQPLIEAVWGLHALKDAGAVLHAAAGPA